MLQFLQICNAAHRQCEILSACIIVYKCSGVINIDTERQSRSYDTAFVYDTVIVHHVFKYFYDVLALIFATDMTLLVVLAVVPPIFLHYVNEFICIINNVSELYRTACIIIQKIYYHQWNIIHWLSGRVVTVRHGSSLVIASLSQIIICPCSFSRRVWLSWRFHMYRTSCIYAPHGIPLHFPRSEYRSCGQRVVFYSAGEGLRSYLRVSIEGFQSLHQHIDRSRCVHHRPVCTTRCICVVLHVQK